VPAELDQAEVGDHPGWRDLERAVMPEDLLDRCQIAGVIDTQHGARGHQIDEEVQIPH
jgi:hypothetical protein